MRRLAAPFLLLLCILALSACKSKKRRAPFPPAATESTGATASMIQVADPRTSLQLIQGFYDVESGSWRWTARKFSVTLQPPKSAAQKGATLVVKLTIPDVVVRKLNSIQLSATVNGLATAPEAYTQAGDHTFSRDIPSSALPGATVRVDFTLDKALPPNAADDRELGVIVSAIGFEAKG